MAFVSLENINMVYNKQNHVLKDFNLEVEKGELVSLLGPSERRQRCALLRDF